LLAAFLRDEARAFTAALAAFFFAAVFRRCLVRVAVFLPAERLAMGDLLRRVS